MLNSLSSFKEIKDQTPGEKMYLLKQMAHQMLGPKWKYFQKIKSAGKGFRLIKEKSHLEQMKATQAALRFTSKNAKKAYRSAYQACLQDIRKNTSLPKENFPELPETTDGEELPSLTSSFDAVIASWTPIKFLLPAKLIRDKGAATQRHSEGLVAKLYFKIVAYYATSENWNTRKLTFYLRKIDKDSSYRDVGNALEPLKNDLSKFAEAYEPFKFGKASLAKDASQEDDTFDDAMGIESFESQIQTLYWYHFIYWAMELFLFRYFLTLVTSTESHQAIRYLANIFEPVIRKSIENKNIFLGSFEIDRSKSQYRAPYEKLKQKRQNDPFLKKVKTSKGIFVTYSYNLQLLEKSTIGFEMESLPNTESEWGNFVKYNIMGMERPVEPVEEDQEASSESVVKVEDELEEIEPISLEAREYALMQIMSIMAKCTRFRRESKHKILERFKNRTAMDQELATKRITEIRKQASKKIVQMDRKVAKLKRMKQEEGADAFQKDIEKFKKMLETKCETIRQNSQKELQLQKARLQTLFKEIAKEDATNTGLTSNIVLKLTDKINPDSEFSQDFLKFAINNIQEEYSHELEAFYENMFDILEPSTQEKVVIIQSLQKSGGDQAPKLSLDEEEKAQSKIMFDGLKAKIDKSLPGIFNGKLIFLSLAIPFEDLFQISIDNQSLQTLLRFKVTTPKNAKPAKLQGTTIKALLVLNMFHNPVPKNNLILDGKENEQDPQKAVNTSLLNKLLAGL